MEDGEKKQFRVLLLTRYFPPEIGTAATLFYDLARELKRQGVSVAVVTGFPWYNLQEIPDAYRKGVFKRERFDGIDVIRVRLNILGPRKLKLLVGHLFSPISMLVGGLLSGRVDIIYGYSPPLLVGIVGGVLRKLKGCPFVLGVQDLHPQAYIDQGVLKSPFLIRILEGLERVAYKSADGITVHSDGNREMVQSKLSRDRATKIYTLSNWVDVEAMTLSSEINEFENTLEVNGKFVVGYAGTLGLSQGSGIIVEAAELLTHLDDLIFVIVGDGIDKKTLISDCNRRGLSNVRFFDMQPAEKYPSVVDVFDVGVVTLNAKVDTPVIPSKILSLMASGTPIVGSLPVEGDSGALIKKAKCGLVTEPGNAVKFAESIETLYKDRNLRESYEVNGRDYAVQNFALPRITKSLKTFFEKKISGRVDHVE